MKEIYVEPMGFATLVNKMADVPEPRKLIGAFEGYRFYKTTGGKYAIEE